MIGGPVAGRRVHPFTPLVLVAAILALAIALPAPGGAVVLYGLTVALVVAAGHPRAVAAGALACLPLWLFLVVLHVLLSGGDGPAAALAQGARLGAVATASAAMLDTFDSSRFLDAVAERGWSFHSAYLVVATLQALPRLRQRARTIQEAQRARGLRLRGSPLHKLRALVPLTLPLMLASLAEVDDRAAALDTRAIGTSRRTALVPPVWRTVDLVACGVAIGAVVAAIVWRAARVTQ